jgi:2-methylcitrate dehydratase PrpD
MQKGWFIMEGIEKSIRLQAEFAKTLRYEGLDDGIIQRAKWIILDSIGCIIKGLKNNKLRGSKDDKILNCAMSMIATELYEGNRKAIGHPACHILPLMFMEAEANPISFEKFLTTFVAAYEIASRWGSAIRFSNNILGHGTVMTVGAGLAKSLLDNDNENEIYEVILLTNSLPNVSVWQSVFDGSALHDAYAGLGAITAGKAVQMQKQGVRSSVKIIENIYTNVFGATINQEMLSYQLSQEYWITNNYFKVHTGCRFVHPFADILKREIDKGLKREAVDNIKVFTYKKAAQLTSQSVPNDLAAKFSIPVSLAVLLEKGKLSSDAIENCNNNEAIKTLAKSINLYEEQIYNELLPEIRAGRMEIYLNDGRVLIDNVYHAVGDFDNPIPFTENDLIQKFRDNTQAVWCLEEQDTVIQNILQNENKQANISDLLALFFNKIQGGK